MKILILIGTYLPGTKAGGPVRSIDNMIEALSDEFTFYVLTQDRDIGEQEPYASIRYDGWNRVGRAWVWYVERFTEEIIANLGKGVDVVYICGCFDTYARMALKLKKQARIMARVIVAAMGLFSPGAFRIKRVKKTAYMFLMKQLGLFRNIEWSATDDEEVKNIRHRVGRDVVCHIAEDIPRIMTHVSIGEASESGKLRIISLSRISPEKNLEYSIEVAEKLRGTIVFDIYGNIEDRAYYDICKKRISKMPDNVKINYKGIVAYEDVVCVMAQYDVFLFPTKGENFGHVIIEALQAGCIPVISACTPWRDLETKGAGKALPLDNMQGFVDYLQGYVDMSGQELQQYKEKSYQYARAYDHGKNVQSYRNMFKGEDTFC